jgi:hypothetical protein
MWPILRAPVNSRMLIHFLTSKAIRKLSYYVQDLVPDAEYIIIIVFIVWNTPHNVLLLTAEKT